MKCDSVWWVARISWLGYIRESVHSVASVTNLQHQSEIFASLIQSLLGSVFWLHSPHREWNARRNGGQRATERTFTRKLNYFCNIYTHPHVFSTETLRKNWSEWTHVFHECKLSTIFKNLSKAGNLKKSVSTKKHSNYSVQDQRGNPY